MKPVLKQLFYELAVASLAFAIGNEYGGSEAEGNTSCLAISWLL